MMFTLFTFCSHSVHTLFTKSSQTTQIVRKNYAKATQTVHILFTTTMKVRFDYFNNKSEWKSKEIPLDDLYAQIKSGKYARQCSRLSYKLAVIPNIVPRTKLEDT